MNKKLRIIFLGTPEFAVENLRILVENGHHIVGVVTAPDKPAGRGQKIQETAIKKYASSIGLNILQPTNLKDESFILELKSLKADLQIVVAFRMLPEIVWNMPPLGTFNLHASLLPQYRGAAPINRAIMNGETETGVTTFFLQQEIDTGNIILQKAIPIPDETNAGELHDQLMKIGSDLVLETVNQIINNKIETVPQNHIPIENLKFAPKIFKHNCQIDWNSSLNQIHNQVRGLSPYPTAWTKLNDKSLKIFRGKKIKAEHNERFGKIACDSKTFLKIAVDGGYYQIEELQLEGKKRLNIFEFLRGYSGQLPELIG